MASGLPWLQPFGIVIIGSCIVHLTQSAQGTLQKNVPNKLHTHYRYNIVRYWPPIPVDMAPWGWGKSFLCGQVSQETLTWAVIWPSTSRNPELPSRNTWLACSYLPFSDGRGRRFRKLCNHVVSSQKVWKTSLKACRRQVFRLRVAMPHPATHGWLLINPIKH